jgi:hypothetical protein
MAMRKEAFGVSSNGSTAPLQTGSWGKELPKLVEFLSEAKWEDGSTRVLGTMLVFVESGVWKACLHERGLHASCFVSGSSPQELFRAVEAGLRDGSLAWRSKGGRRQGTT